MSRIREGVMQTPISPILTDVGASLEAIASTQTEEASLYIVLTDTNSRFSKISKRLTKQPYNHASISFDESLETLYTYALVNRSGLKGGIKKESLEDLEGARYSMYELPVTQDVWDEVRAKVRSMEENPVGTSYNHLALLNFLFNRELFSSDSSSKMFCSQFVIEVLGEVGIELFTNRSSTTVKPYDFVKSKLLRFVRRGTFRR